MLIIFLWPSALLHGTWLVWGWLEVKGIVELILKCCLRREVFNTLLNFSSADWKSSGKETLIAESHSSENYRTLIGYLGEVFSVELPLLKARLCVILRHSHRRK